MEYIVCESRRSKNYDSRPDDVPVKIHTVLCTNYQERELNIWSMKWSLVFNKIKDAEKYAAQTERHRPLTTNSFANVPDNTDGRYPDYPRRG